jgi:rsbT co-antagonist protein RsbR
MADEVGAERIPGLLTTRRDAVLDRWVRMVAGGLRGRITQRELRGELTELYGLVERSAAAREAAGDGAGTAGGELRAALAEMSRSRARQGFSPTETAISVFALKEAVHEELDAAGDAPSAHREFLSFSSFIDDLGLSTFEAYTIEREQVINDQAQQLLELSTPVVKIWDGILGVPLIGTLDSARAQMVMETLLQTLVETGSRHAVIDITGVAAVDTEVAQHLLKTVMAARLMGTDCVISGIRPQIAQTIVALGIEFGDIVTRATLADAMTYLMERAGLRVVPAARDGRGD